MAENSGEQRPLEPDAIITPDGKTINFSNGKPIPEGRIIRGKTGPSGRTQEELQRDFRPIPDPQKPSGNS